jgi:predicted MFS family arabinose efflux permease
VITLSLAGGAALGSSIIDAWGYTGIFLVSGFGRILAALFFLVVVNKIEGRR